MDTTRRAPGHHLRTGIGIAGAATCGLILTGLAVRSASPPLSAVLLLSTACALALDRRLALPLAFAIAPAAFLLREHLSFDPVEGFAVSLCLVIFLHLARGGTLSGVLRRPHPAVAVPVAIYIGLSWIAAVRPAIRCIEFLHRGTFPETTLAIAQAVFSGRANPLSLSWHMAVAGLLVLVAAAEASPPRRGFGLHGVARIATAGLGAVAITERIAVDRLGAEGLYPVLASRFPPGRMPGTFAWPSHLAAYLNLSLPIVMAYLITFDGPRRSRAFLSAAAAALLGGAGMLLSMTRGGWLGLLLSAALLLALASRAGLPRRRLLVAAAMGGILLLPTTAALFQVRRQMAHDAAPEPHRGRMGYTWPAAVSIIRDCPFLGCGPGEWRDVAPLHAPRVVGPSATERAHAHNVILHAAAERGLFAAAAFLALLAASLALLVRHAVHDPGTPGVTLGVAAGLAGFLAHGMLEDVVYAPDLFFCFWALVGLAGRERGDSW